MWLDISQANNFKGIFTLIENHWWVQISSGRGPVECCWVVARLAEVILNEAEKQGVKAEIIEAIPGEAGQTFKSILISMKGVDCSVIKPWIGTVQWVGKSHFRPQHKRKNWYVGVELYMPSEQTKWSDNEFKVETMRASGPGGQHLNKVESAVRVIHLPTGLSTSVKEERSQYLNKRLAMARMVSLFEFEEEKKIKSVKKDCWYQHNELERGKPVKIFKGRKFQVA
ncbi:MAG: peptide chain release factor H [Pseudomonadota bacterium]